MNQSYDYDQILKKSLDADLLWFEEEFDQIFKSKIKFTKQEINMANQILEMLTKITNIYNNEQLLYPLARILNSLEKKYPAFF